MKSRTVAALAVATAVMLSACGFQLRGANQASLPFSTIHIGLPDTSSFGTELRRRIRAREGTTVVTDPNTAQARLEVLSESREKQILSLNSQGRVREYVLFYKLRFRVTNTAGKEWLAPTEIVLKRDISFNESQVIAKEREEEMLYREMQTDLAQQVLRRLSALQPA